MKKVVVLALLLCVCIGSLFAEDKDKRKKKSITDTIFQIDEVNVVKTKKTNRVQLLNLNVPLRYVPLTVTSLPGAVLERKGIVNLEDAVRFLPGVTISNQLGPFKAFSVRGSRQSLVMIDGIRDDRAIMNTAPFGDLASVERIEVIKGAASILGGHSAMGGVINIIRKKVTPDFTANARISYGSWNEKRATMGFGGTLVGPIEYRANLHYSHGDGYRDVTSNRFSGFAALGATLGKSRVDVCFGFHDDNYTTEIGSAPYMPGDMFDVKTNELVLEKGALNPFADYDQTYGDHANDFMNRKDWNLDFNYVYTFSESLKLRERFAFDHSFMRYCTVEGVSYLTSTAPKEGYNYVYYKKNKGALTPTYVCLDSLQRSYPLGFYPRHNTWNNTLELTGDWVTGMFTHHYTVGWSFNLFDYLQYNGWNEKENDNVGPGVKAKLTVVNPHLVQGWWENSISAVVLRKDYTNGFYIHDVIEVTDQWKVMFAGRMDFFRRQSATATPTDKERHYDKENRSEWQKVSTSAFTYRAGLVYIPMPELSFYASMASYFTPNTTVYNPNTIYIDRNGKAYNPDTDGGEVFKPTRGYQAEVGVRYTLNDMVDFNASIFYLRQLNIVKNVGTQNVESTDANGELFVEEKTIQAQIGTADSRGLDMEIILTPVSTLQITAGLGVSDYRTRAILKSSAFPDYVETNKNMRTTGAPRTTFYVFGDYTIPRGIFKNLSFHLSGNFTDKVFKNVATRSYTPALWLMDGGIFYTIKRNVMLAVNVNNLFDKEYFTQGNKPVKGMPRNFQASVSYNF